MTSKPPGNHLVLGTSNDQHCTSRRTLPIKLRFRFHFNRMQRLRDGRQESMLGGPFLSPMLMFANEAKAIRNGM